jgi:hypothetical protein
MLVSPLLNYFLQGSLLYQVQLKSTRSFTVFYFGFSYVPVKVWLISNF